MRQIQQITLGFKKGTTLIQAEEEARIVAERLRAEEARKEAERLLDQLLDAFAAVDADDGSCEIVVRDNGRGLDPTEVEHVFEAFHRGSEEGTDGTGIGLAVCLRIVRHHCGSIWAEGEPGVGSAVHVRLCVASTRVSPASTSWPSTAVVRVGALGSSRAVLTGMWTRTVVPGMGSATGV